MSPLYLLEPLAPPVIWITHFMVVYLFAEQACTVGWTEFEYLGFNTVSWVTVVATLLALAAIGYVSFLSWQMWSDASGVDRMTSQAGMLGLMGMVSAVIFSIATIAVGLPAVVLEPCL